MNVADELIATLRASGERLGKEFGEQLEGARAYMAEQMLELSKAVDEPGYQEALIAVRDNVAMQAGMRAADAGDATDRELMGILSGGLAVAARALASAGTGGAA